MWRSYVPSTVKLTEVDFPAANISVTRVRCCRVPAAALGVARQTMQVSRGKRQTTLPMHGGAPGSGAPRGNKNAMKHGLYTRKAIEERRKMKELLRQVRQQLQAIG